MRLDFPGTTADLVVAGAYLLWITITLCWVLRCRHLCPGIVSTLAPSWPLFAPDPIVYDFDLAFRLKRADGSFSPWRPLPAGYSRAWHHAVWNPGFDEQIFLFRLCHLLVAIKDPRVESLQQRAHDFLLSLVAIRAGGQPERVEFLITRCRPLDSDHADVVFLSESEA
jgi:hypothetical protein